MKFLENWPTKMNKGEKSPIKLKKVKRVKFKKYKRKREMLKKEMKFEKSFDVHLFPNMFFIF